MSVGSIRRRCLALPAALIAVFAVGAVAAAPAFASGRPLVAAEAATSVTETGATLHGAVNPDGPETKYWFEYGKEGKYEHKTAEVSAGSGEANIKVVKAITGLATGAKYGFRIVAMNVDGTTYGGEEALTTTGTGKPFVETRQATGKSKTAATLNGIVNPSGFETKYYFEYGTEKGKFTKTTAEASAGSGTTNVEESKTITGLTEGTTYYFRIVATNSKGTTDGSEETVVAGVVQPEFVLGTGEKFPVTIEGTQHGTADLSTSGGNFIECKEHKSQGEITGAKAASLTIELTGCRLVGPEVSCKTEGSPAEHIVLPGSGTLVYISKSTKKIGLLFNLPEVVYECEDGLGGGIRGSIVIPVTPINTKTTKFDLPIHGAKGVQEPTEYENEKSEVKKARFEMEATAGFTTAALQVEGENPLTTSKALTVEG
jgi:hypothetical protein